MSLKLLDIQYLRAQNSSNGQVLITTASSEIAQSNLLIISDTGVGVGTSTTDAFAVVGNISLFGSNTSIVFGDGTVQSTAAAYTPPGGIVGTVQYKDNSNNFNGSINLFWDSSSNRLGIGTSIPKSTLQIKNVGYESTDRITSTIDPIVLDSFPVPDYRSCHYIIQVTDTNYSWFHTTQIMLIHDGASVYKSEYNIVTTADKLGTFDCAINSGNVELTFTALFTSDKNIKVIRTSITP